jgi:hypothetical protein
VENRLSEQLRFPAGRNQEEKENNIEQVVRSQRGHNFLLGQVWARAISPQVKRT